MRDYFFNGIWRMDWGFGNPNKTGAFIAMLMVGIWGLAYIRHRWFWIALPTFTMLGIALVHTFSRGGIVALVTGSIPLLAFAPRPWRAKRIIAVLGAVAVLIGTAIYLGAVNRYSKGITSEDRSITNRLLIWSETPKMMADSPAGWGFGNAATAYMQWYQPLSRSENYLNLVNTHLTWMVEMNWVERFIYVFAWSLAIWFCWPSKSHQWLSVPLGLWISFFTACIFSFITDNFVIWILPCASIIIVFLYRIKNNAWLNATTVLIPLGITILSTGSIALIGLRPPHDFSGSKSSVIFGKMHPSIWVVYNETTMGLQYGKTLRRYLDSQPSLNIGFALTPSAAVGADSLILGGTVSFDQISSVRDLLNDATSVILLNPEFFPHEISLEEHSYDKITAVFGEYAKSPSANAWRAICNTRQLQGIGDFIPNWPELVLNELAALENGKE